MGIFVAVLLLVRRGGDGTEAAIAPTDAAPGADVETDGETGGETGGEPLPDPDEVLTDVAALLRAGSPYLILIALVLVTRLVPAVTDALASLELAWSLDGGFSGAIVLLTHPGTLLVVAFLLGALVQGALGRTATGALRSTLKQLIPVTIALLAMLLLARLMVRSGMTEALAEAAAGSTASIWPVLAPLVGVLGTFVTGSGTASNVLFTDLQLATAEQLGYDPLPLLGAQNFGASVGNQIAPHNIVAGGATVGLTGGEADVMRRTIGIALVYGLLGGLLALLLVG
jgi:lactate permease